MQNFAQMWNNYTGALANVFLYVGSTGALEIIDKTGQAQGGRYSILVPEQTGKRYAVP